MSNQTSGNYYLPQPSHWPIVASVALAFLGFGASLTVNHMSPGPLLLGIGFLVLFFMFAGWFTTVAHESEAGSYNKQVDVSFRWGMGWFIFSEVITSYRPQCAAVELVFVNVNPQSTLLLGQARGVAICAAVSGALPVAEYTALQVKQAVAGTGNARKEQVQAMVKLLLKLPGDPSADAADALACAICHAHGGQGYGGLGIGRRRRAGRLR